MEILVGFILGILSSFLAGFVFHWVTEIYTFEKQRPLIAYFRNPRVFIKTHFDTEERKVKNLICKLFKAWCEKDSESYLSCWSENCIRIYGNDFEYKEDRQVIKEKFLISCDKYSEIKVPVRVLEEIDISEDLQRARVIVYYRFNLIRAADLLPVSEYSKEVYVLVKNEDQWKISSNVDYFISVTKK